MDKDDLSNLLAMKQLASPPILRGMQLADLADQLLKKRDALKLKDDEWYASLTHHIVTLDSAATFEPNNEADRHQLDNAINIAISELQNMIGEKLM